MSATAEADPLRAEVEERLRLLFSSAVGTPCAALRGAQRATGHAVARLTAPVAQPIAVVRSMIELMLSGVLGRAPERAPAVRHDPTAAGADAPVDAWSQVGGVSLIAMPDRRGTDGGNSGPASELPLEGYESLAASQVVDRLPRLNSTELLQIKDFELANRGRRTILGKIDQLLQPR